MTYLREMTHLMFFNIVAKGQYVVERCVLQIVADLYIARDRYVMESIGNDKRSMAKISSLYYSLFTKKLFTPSSKISWNYSSGVIQVCFISMIT